MTAENADSEEANHYLSLIKVSDDAFQELVTYFSAVDEKVIICMFGDHQPKFEDDDFYETIYDQTDGLSETDKVLNQYKTPFVIWVNYDIDADSASDDWEDIGMSYLGEMLMETAGLEMSPYFCFLQDYRKQYPIVSSNGYVDAQGNFYNWSGENDELPEYRMLQYNYLFGDTVEWGFSVGNG